MLGNANVWFYKKDEGDIKILFQKRSKFVDGNPGMYDVSAGGHIDPGETPEEAALRETREEIGVALKPSDLSFLGLFETPKKSFYVYAVDWTGKPDDFNLDPKEVESVKWVSFSDLDTFVEKSVKLPLRENPAQLLALKELLSENNEY